MRILQFILGVLFGVGAALASVVVCRSKFWPVEGEDGQIKLDRNLAIISIRPEIERSLGYLSGELVGNSILSFVYRNDAQIVEHELKNAMSGTYRSDWEARLTSRDGKTTVEYHWHAAWSDLDRSFSVELSAIEEPRLVSTREGDGQA